MACFLLQLIDRYYFYAPLHFFGLGRRTSCDAARKLVFSQGVLTVSHGMEEGTAQDCSRLATSATRI
jgi:hypothetical protein